jgi:TetR/AcrR family transcriptional regulator
MGAEPGRARNPKGTRRAVLDAAERLFADRGFAGTSMRDIASASGVSQPLIHHHFGGKEALYTAVRRQVSEDYAAQFPEVGWVTDRPVDVRAELETIYEFLRNKPSLLRLLEWARLEGNNRMGPGEQEVVCALLRRIEVAQERGIIRRDLGAAHLCVMLLALVSFWVDNRSFFACLFAEGPDDHAYLQQAIALLERGLDPSE